MGVLHMMTLHYLNFTLETFQAGLSWITILNKEKISKLLLITLIIKNAQYSDKILDLLQDAGIIRNKLKVYSAVTNAQAFLKSKKNLEVFAIHLGFCKSHTCYQLPKKLKRSSCYFTNF
jgi:DNA-3-methyladenine glycosylase I